MYTSSEICHNTCRIGIILIVELLQDFLHRIKLLWYNPKQCLATTNFLFFFHPFSTLLFPPIFLATFSVIMMPCLSAMYFPSCLQQCIFLLVSLSLSLSPTPLFSLTYLSFPREQDGLKPASILLKKTQNLVLDAEFPSRRTVRFSTVAQIEMPNY